MQAYLNPQAVFDTAFGVVYSLALVWLVSGTLYRLSVWLRSRSRLQIPLTPAPRTRIGVAKRLVLEVVAFRSLARASKITWLASVLFHYALLWLMIIHMRFVFQSLPVGLITFIQFSAWATFCFIIGLSMLLLRRLFVDRVRYISSHSDYLHLILLLSIAISGLVLKRVSPVNLFEVGEFFRGVLLFSWKPLPDHAALLVHLALVLVLVMVFPLSKLLHGIAVVISPTFNQRDKG